MSQTLEQNVTVLTTEQNSGSPPSTLFVGDLSFFCDENDLRTLFSQHGEVLATQLKRGKTGDSLMHGFVEMATHEEAEAARSSLMDTKYMGRKIRINWAYTAVVPRNRDGWVQVHVSFVTREMKEKINEEVLDSIFSAYGEVADITIKHYVRDTAGNVQSGYGFVFFLDSEAAAVAVKKIRKILIRGVTYDSSFSYRSEKELSIKHDSPTGAQSNQTNSPPDQRPQTFSHPSSPSVQYREVAMVHPFVPVHQQHAQQFFAPSYYGINQPPYYAISSQQPAQANSNAGSHPNSPARTLHQFAPMGVSYVAVNSPSQYAFPVSQHGTNSPPELSLPAGIQYYQQYFPSGNVPMYNNYPGQSLNAPQMTYQLSSSPNLPPPPMVSMPAHVQSHSTHGQHMSFPHHLNVPVSVMVPHPGARADSPSTYSQSAYHPVSNTPSPMAYMMTNSPHGGSLHLHAPMQVYGASVEYENLSDHSSPSHSSNNTPKYMNTINNQVHQNRQKHSPPPIVTTNNSNDSNNKSQHFHQPSPHLPRSFPSPKENGSQYTRPPVGSKRGFDRSSPKSQDLYASNNNINSNFVSKETGELKRPPSLTLPSSFSSNDDSIDRLTIGIGAMGHSDSSSSSPLHCGMPSVAAVSH